MVLKQTELQCELYRLYPRGTVNKSDYNVIDLQDKSKKHTYLIIDTFANTYYQLSSITDIKRHIQMLYGFNITIKASNKTHLAVCRLCEQLLPDSIDVYNQFGLIAKVKLYCNLLNNQLDNILIKEGVTK